MEIYIPDGTPEDEALARTTHLAVSAHEDDIEFMAYDGILRCYDSAGNSFTAVVEGNGGGSPRSGKYAALSDEEMICARKSEQMRAADIGKYGALIMLGLPSARIKDARDREATENLKRIIERTRPRVIYTHNPADKHDTHVAAALRLICALRELGYVPEHLYGCEVWRGLDWVTDSEKVSFSVGGRAELEGALLRVFDSQIAGGKKYDSAVIGRRRANATFGESHGVDTDDEISFAIDMTELIRDPEMSVSDYIDGYIESFRRDVKSRLERLL